MNGYKGKVRFNREQLVFAAEVILVAALDRVEAALPSSISWDERIDEANGDPEAAKDLLLYESGAVGGASMALSVLYAQLTNDGMGMSDAIHAAGKFDEAISRLVVESWADEGKAVKRKIRARKDRSFSIEEVLPSYPNCLWHAEQFVDQCFDKYLGFLGANSMDVDSIHTPEKQPTLDELLNDHDYNNNVPFRDRGKSPAIRGDAEASKDRVVKAARELMGDVGEEHHSPEYCRGLFELVNDLYGNGQDDTQPAQKMLQLSSKAMRAMYPALVMEAADYDELVHRIDTGHYNNGLRQFREDVLLYYGQRHAAILNKIISQHVPVNYAEYKAVLDVFISRI